MAEGPAVAEVGRGIAGHLEVRGARILLVSAARLILVVSVSFLLLAPKPPL